MTVSSLPSHQHPRYAIKVGMRCGHRKPRGHEQLGDIVRLAGADFEDKSAAGA